MSSDAAKFEQLTSPSGDERFTTSAFAMAFRGMDIPLSVGLDPSLPILCSVGRLSAADIIVTPGLWFAAAVMAALTTSKSEGESTWQLT